VTVRTALLTTDTTHHAYYAWKLAERHPLDAIVVETLAPTPPFETFHPFEARREEYEREVLSAAFGGALSDVAPVIQAESANDAVGSLAELGLDVVLVFGTGLLRASVFELPRVACLNLHGGDPEEYRGLDTHLWAIYHGDFPALVTTLHHVDAELDCGDIAGQAPVPLPRGTRLHELRARNTEVCLSLSVDALDAAARDGVVPRRRQAKRGRYYSWMPAVLKDGVVARFERHTGAL
jgi:methionyl-tRNA formyltransferase